MWEHILSDQFIRLVGQTVMAKMCGMQISSLLKL